MTLCKSLLLEFRRRDKGQMTTVLPLIAFPLLYAETHYRFKYFFSFLKTSEPEILADLPHRLEPDTSLPILLLIKDSDKYPVALAKVKVSIMKEGEVLQTINELFSSSNTISQALWWKVFHVQFKNEIKDIYGDLEIDVEFIYTVGGKERTSKNDNHRTSSKRPFRVYRSEHPLPSFKGWVLGDTHTHSSYTSDQVEFGSPIEASVALSKAIGLSFFCVTDHSYDLDDKVDNYLINDPGVPKWWSLQREIDSLNSHGDGFVVIRGEEVSCFNSIKRNVHLLLFGTKEFFAGSGDSAERWFRTTAEHTIPDVLATKEVGVAAYAGHPTEPTPFFQWLLIRRGEWSLEDMSENGLSGLQILNGEVSAAFQKGLRCWIELLLRGRRIMIAAGNDAHGNFNRFRQIGIPFFWIRESPQQLFGKMRTALQLGSLDEKSLIESLRLGRSVITNGPMVIFQIKNEAGEIAMVGGKISGSRLRIEVEGATTKEFGAFMRIEIVLGKIGGGNELIFLEKRLSDDLAVKFSIDFEGPSPFIPSYLRVQGFTTHGKKSNDVGFCYTNPIWIERQ